MNLGIRVFCLSRLFQVIMRWLSSVVVLLSSVSGHLFTDPCGLICVRVPGACGSGGSYCKNDHACHNLFWRSDRQTTEQPFCHAPLCDARNVVRCTSAAEWLTPSMRKLTETSPPIIARGIHNTGAICYVSSVVQILVHAKSLRTILSGDTGRALLDAYAGGPLNSFKQLLDDMWTNIPDRPVYMTEFLAVMKSFTNNVLFNNVSDDASDALDRIVDAIVSAGIPELDSVFKNDILNTKFCGACGHQSTSSGQNTFVQRIPVPTSSVVSNLEDLIRDVLFPPLVSTGVRCDACGDSEHVTVVPKINTPQLMAFGIVRFQEMMEEAPLSTSVQIPMLLDMSAWSNGGAALYRLIGVVLHSGGHYTAQYNHPDTDNHWYHADDRNVELIIDGTPTNVGPNVYLVLYELAV
jgi:ubiquitin C-terminal hydrolase